MKRYAQTIVACVYFLLCLSVSIWAGFKEPKPVRMTFVSFGFMFFLYSYLSFFYAIANFSEAEKWHERKKHKPKPLSLKKTSLLLLFGAFCFVLLLWLFFQRAS